MQEAAGRKRIAKLESRIEKLGISNDVIVGLNVRADYMHSMIELMPGEFADFVESLGDDAGWVRDGCRTSLNEAFDEAWWVLDKWENHKETTA